VFSICMILTAFAPTAEMFGGLRFLTGLGLGGVV
jgi:AAHS family benzoate transporter-like MFS transporter